LLGSICAAVAVVGIGVLGDQSGSEQGAMAWDRSMLAAAAPIRCVDENTAKVGMETTCHPGCRYEVIFNTSGTVSIDSQYVGDKAAPRGEVIYTSASGGATRPISCGSGSTPVSLNQALINGGISELSYGTHALNNIIERPPLPDTGIGGSGPNSGCGPLMPGFNCTPTRDVQTGQLQWELTSSCNIIEAGYTLNTGEAPCTDASVVPGPKGRDNYLLPDQDTNSAAGPTSGGIPSVSPPIPQPKLAIPQEYSTGAIVPPSNPPGAPGDLGGSEASRKVAETANPIAPPGPSVASPKPVAVEPTPPRIDWEALALSPQETVTEIPASKSFVGNPGDFIEPPPAGMLTPPETPATAATADHIVPEPQVAPGSAPQSYSDAIGNIPVGITPEGGIPVETPAPEKKIIQPEYTLAKDGTPLWTKTQTDTSKLFTCGGPLGNPWVSPLIGGACKITGSDESVSIGVALGQGVGIFGALMNPLPLLLGR